MAGAAMQLTVRLIARRAMQAALVAAGVTVILLICSRQAHAATTQDSGGGTGSLTSAVTSATNTVTSTVSSATKKATSAVTGPSTSGGSGSGSGAAATTS